MMLGGCTTYGQPPLAVKVPSDCDRNARSVAYPNVTSNMDLGSVAARHRAALVQANKRLAAVRACNEKVRKSYAKQ